ncbi:conserved hypothetical protein [Theileria equi strain WA]|uniref:Protein RER1 n=1 Tax=Theileria equi strain WA TaxID=1537102 RepID=L1LD61_THEEQ|nr:conserved hypothetical protein [Theileria equi strain WA]EKX73261.1 conserved hypothetical protein [Theileria equi strain WA]|eukprot:XP_004832713.1 conserved hypothetical protein [Theileria equi strain WA]
MVQSRLAAITLSHFWFLYKFSRMESSTNRIFKLISCYHQLFLDHTVKYVTLRWMYFGFISTLFWIYIFTVNTHYVIAYMYAVFLLNLLLRFITPLSFDDLCAAQEDANGGTILPCSENDAKKSGVATRNNAKSKDNVYEFKPFLRQMNEFTFWLSATRITYIALCSLFFEFLDLPVFWPLLVLYFALLFTTTMNQQIRNMIKYKYVPFNFSKRTYGSVSRS